MDWYQKLGLKRIINAAGNMTYLGASRISRGVAEAMIEGASQFVDMAELKERASQLLSQWTGSEAGLVVPSAAAGIVTSVAAALTYQVPDGLGALPGETGGPMKAVILKAHAVNFGAPITQIAAVTGAKIVEVGQVNRATDSEIRFGLREAACWLYVISHHADPHGSIPLSRVVEMAHSVGCPVIVDAAAERDYRKYVEADVDLVIYSGHKAAQGPTSGFVVGHRNLVEEAQRHQDMGVGRAMKVGKEQILGLLAALSEALSKEEGEDERRWQEHAHGLKELLAPFFRTEIVRDERGIPRCLVHENPETLRKLVAFLEQGDPSIRTRNHNLEAGSIMFDTRHLSQGDLAVISERCRDFLMPSLGGSEHERHD